MYNLQWSTTGQGLGVETTYVNNVPTQISTGWNSAGASILDGYGTLIIKGKSYQCLRRKYVEAGSYTAKNFDYFTKDSILLFIDSGKDQNDTAIVKVKGVTIYTGTTIVATPSAPSLASPSNGATGVSTNPTLSWNASSGATSYRLQVSTNSSFSSLVVDQSSITGTSYTVSNLHTTTTYYWQVNATNTGGTSSYSSTWSFTTAGPTLVEQIGSELPHQNDLYQNYPNPFNPTTTIEFSLPRSGYTTLKVFNTLGEEVATLVAENVSAGRYKVEWNADGLASGIYLYRLQAREFVETKKLVLLK